MSATPLYIHLRPGASLPRLHQDEPCRVVLFAEMETPASFHGVVAQELVHGKCLYFMSCGSDCDAWHDAVDMANIEQFDFKEIPESAFVMTTWHDKEPLSEVLWFCKYNAFHPTVELNRTVLIHVATEANEPALLQGYAAA
jgi:hypothetical protein